MRIHKLLVTSLLAVLISAPAVYSADVAKIGIIDFQQIVEESEPGKQAKAEINAQGSKMQAELKRKADDLKEMEKQLERDSLVTSQEKQEQNQRDFRIKLNDFKGLQKKYEQNLQRLQKKIIGQLQKDVFLLAKEIGKKEGYQLILESTGVLYVPKSLNITDRVIAEYNKKGLELEQKKEKESSE